MQTELKVLGLGELLEKAKANGCVVVDHHNFMAISVPRTAGLRTHAILDAITYQSKREGDTVRIAR